jgi:hypothetical protein
MEISNFGSKVCKYCGAYYSPEGTWHKENNDYVCQHCWEKYFNTPDGSLCYHREEPKKKKKKGLFRKFFKRD